MVKRINRWKTSKRMQSDCKVYVKQFPGATVECMKDYITRKSYHLILTQARMTDLNTERSPEHIAISIEKKLNLINH